jgi:hypothetical protein
LTRIKNPPISALSVLSADRTAKLCVDADLTLVLTPA